MFCGCNSLEKIDIPNSVVYIGDCAFKNCTNLKEIYISDKISFIDSDCFFKCNSLERIYVSDNFNIHILDNCNISFRKKLLDQVKVIRIG